MPSTKTNHTKSASATPAGGKGPGPRAKSANVPYLVYRAVFSAMQKDVQKDLDCLMRVKNWDADVDEDWADRLVDLYVEGLMDDDSLPDWAYWDAVDDPKRQEWGQRYQLTLGEIRVYLGVFQTKKVWRRAKYAVWVRCPDGGELFLTCGKHPALLLSGLFTALNWAMTNWNHIEESQKALGMPTLSRHLGYFLQLAGMLSVWQGIRSRLRRRGKTSLLGRGYVKKVLPLIPADDSVRTAVAKFCSGPPADLQGVVELVRAGGTGWRDADAVFNLYHDCRSQAEWDAVGLPREEEEKPSDPLADIRDLTDAEVIDRFFPDMKEEMTEWLKQVPAEVKFH